MQCTQNLNGLSIIFYCLQSEHTILGTMMSSTPQCGTHLGLPQLLHWTYSEHHTYVHMNLTVWCTTYIHTYIYLHLQACAVQLIVNLIEHLCCNFKMWHIFLILHGCVHACVWKNEFIETLVKSTHIRSRCTCIFCCVYYNLYMHACTQFAQAHAISFSLVHMSIYVHNDMYM